MQKQKISKEDKRIGLILIIPSLFLIALLFLYPLVQTFGYSFSYKNLLRPDLGIKFIGLKNFIWVVTHDMFGSVMARTLIYTLSICFLSIVISLLIALLMNCDFVGKGVAFALLMIPWVTSDIVTSFIFHWLLDFKNGLLNYALVDILPIMEKSVVWLGRPKLAMLAAIIVGTWRFLPFSILVLSAALKQIPKNLVDAALIDGANKMGVFWNVTLPTIKIPLLVLSIVRFAAVFRNFQGIWLLTGGGPGDATKVLSIWYYLTGFEAFRIGKAAAIAVIIAGITFLVYLIIQKLGKQEVI